MSCLRVCVVAAIAAGFAGKRSAFSVTAGATAVAEEGAAAGGGGRAVAWPCAPKGVF